MDIVKVNDNIFTAKTFISGSEANLLAYEFGRKEDSGPLSLSENFSSTAPVNIIASVAKNKINKLFNSAVNAGAREIEIKGFDNVYDAQKNNIELPSNGYVALVPLERSLQITFPAHDFVMVEPQEVILINSQLGPNISPDSNEETSSVIVASINLL